MTDERSGDRLAPVTYLFGRGSGPAPERPSSVRRPDGDAWAIPGLAPDGTPATPLDADEPGPDDRDARRAHHTGLNALARRGMSVAEMRALLEKRELPADAIEIEIERLEGSGLLDDAALAETLVRTLHDRRRLGRSAIAAELSRRRIPADLARPALEALDGDDELALATEVALKRAAQLRGYDDETARRRLAGYLQRRGYSGSTVSAATRAALDERRGGARGRTSTGPRFE
ncbi:regulatory protein RecX [Galbitalea sp. SE-J8]|uniref:regulatory protein RecX n=1 Tax=Galbitalea sp. SE-J8 TaxID=3054952 RepID=UPI00259D22BF|nr:regulatory protein RecX [Galbitalea sp. SE-J8]MDM4762553.1 regulatory protein RecX [Galbitalea sp. SE-J8]